MKTEEATPRRLRKARAEGDSGASSYAAGSVAFLTAVVTLPAAMYALKDWSADALHKAIAHAAEPGHLQDLQALQVALDPWTLARPVLLYSAPLLLAVAGTALVGTVVQTGGVITVKRLAPRLGRLDLFEGARQLFSREHFFTVGRAFFSAALIGYLAYLGLRSHAPDIAALAGRPEYVARAGATIALRLARTAAILGIAVGALDLAVRRRLWLTRLRMTKDEVLRERKESEGDPAWKAARARAHGERMAQATQVELRDATVVVVAPGFAFALRYRAGDRAPVLLSHDAGARAESTARAARELGLAVIEHGQLAVWLSALPVGEELPEALYEWAAEVIHMARTR